MTFSEWFQSQWKNGDESDHRALIRLSSQTGLSLPTLRSALDGKRVTARSAERICKATEGAVEPVSLWVPTAAEG